MEFKLKNNYWIKYTICFLVFFCFAFLTVLRQNKSMVSQSDGFAQHIKALFFYSHWLRSFARNIFIKHNFHLPTWTFGIGYGGDVITTLSYYAIGDPLNLLTAFIPDAYISRFYNLGVVIRLYAAGHTFSAYCLYKKHTNHTAILTASMMYAFCGYALHCSLSHPFFLLCMICFPLMLLGIEKVINEDYHGLFIFAIAFGALSNFYFFYMEVIFAVIYALWQLFIKKAAERPLIRLLQFLVDGTIGILLAAPIILPMTLHILSDSRSQTAYRLIHIYHLDYYIQLPGQILSSYRLYYWLYPGTTFMEAFVIFLLFVNRKKYRANLNAFIGFLILMCIPACGYFLNGMSYISNRWAWAFIFFICFMTVAMWNDLISPEKRTFRLLCIVSAVYSIYVIILLYARWERMRNEAFFGLLCILATLLLIYFTKKKEIKGREGIISWSILFMTLMSIAVHGYYVQSGVGDLLAEKVISNDEDFVQLNYDTAQAAVAKNAPDSDFYRVDGDTDINGGLLTGVSTADIYYSLTNPYIYEFHKVMGKNVASTYRSESLDGRTNLDAATGMKYFIEGGSHNIVPYGALYWDTITNPDYNRKEYKAYENPNALPLFYGYDSALAASDYDDLTPVEKENLLLKTAVFSDKEAEDKVAGTLPSYDGDLQLPVVDLGVEPVGDIEVIENPDADHTVAYKVGDEGGELSLKYDIKEAGEVYVCFKNLSYKSFDYPENLADEFRHEPNDLQKNIKVTAKLAGSDDKVKNICQTSNDTYKWSNGMSDFAVNLGYMEKTPEEITISISDPGTYYLSDLFIQVMPLNDLSDTVSARLSGISQDTVITKDTGINTVKEIDTKLTLDKDKLILINIPYAKGWTVKIDGQKQELFRVNTLFMGLPVSEGEHNLELVYRTPGLYAGLILCIIGNLLWLITIIVDSIRHSK